MQRKILQFISCALLFVATALGAVAQDGANEPEILLLEFANGKSATYELADKPVVTFADGLLKITAASVETEYAQQDVTAFTFQQKSTGVEHNLSSNFSMRYIDGEHVLFSGVKAGKAVLYDANGRILASYPIANGSLTVDLSGYAQGVYVINLVNERSFKIIKK